MSKYLHIWKLFRTFVVSNERHNFPSYEAQLGQLSGTTWGD
jgi:hypothetical protein